jgi:alanyl-tRNA synthetase
VGDHVEQRGSNITAERLRFDFSHPQKLTISELKKTEKLVNKKITENLQVKKEIMTIGEAKNCGAIGLFGDKYEESVSVYSIDNFSREVCGGPHVKNTGALGEFVIIKEESAAAGIRRIKAILK